MLEKRPVLRRECDEMVGIPWSMETKNLSQQCVGCFSILVWHRERIKVYHRMNKQSDRTIVKFSRRKDCEHVMRKKSELRSSKPSALGLPNATKLYINESLCPYNRVLSNQRKKLWKMQEIFSF